MADVSFTKKTWADGSSGGTPITASELNRMEQGIKDCADGVNGLGDSISHTTSSNWDVFKFPSGLVVATRRVQMQVKATQKFGSVYYDDFQQGYPTVFDEVIYARIDVVNPSGIWWTSLKSFQSSQLTYYIISATQQAAVTCDVEYLMIGTAS